MKTINLLAEDGHLLLDEARRLGAAKETLVAAHAIIDSHCIIVPPCQHCNWRARDKVQTDYRQRISKSELVQRAIQARNNGLDRYYFVTGYLGENPPDFVYEYVAAVKETVDIELYTMLGSVTRSSLERLKKAGLDGYWCGLESPSEKVYAKVRPGDPWEKRIATIRNSKELGLKTWSGFILGLGEDKQDVAKGIEILKDLEVNTISFGRFHPEAHTEMETGEVPQLFWMAKVMAAARIYMENVDIFTNYNFIEWGFLAGCNGVNSPSAYLSIDAREAARLKSIRKPVIDKC